MAIVIRGVTTCPICLKTIENGQEIAAFTNFVPNELDPLRFFNDKAFHTPCFRSHSLAEQAIKRDEELRQHNGPGHRFCVVCQKEIMDPNEYLSLGHLTPDTEHPLFRYNYFQFHRQCLKDWPELPIVYEHLLTLRRSGRWRGKVLGWLIAEMSGASQAI